MKTKEEILAQINSVLATLSGRDPEAIKRALAELDDTFTRDGHDASAAIAAIMDFLKTGQDASTGLDFTVGKGGLLDEANTLRVFLMDHLGSLSVEAQSTAALELARSILSDFGSADEWAISMRNTAWLDSNSKDFIAERVTAMLQHEEWRKKPTGGMLESFDFIVHSQAVNNVSELAKMITHKEPIFDHAAAITLDRLAGVSAQKVTATLNQDPKLFETTPLLRADFFGKLDLDEPAQRKEAEKYLLRPGLTPEERAKFISVLVMENGFAGYSLITAYDLPLENPKGTNARLDAAMRTSDLWLKDSRFSAIHGELAEFQTRIEKIYEMRRKTAAAQAAQPPSNPSSGSSDSSPGVAPGP